MKNPKNNYLVRVARLVHDYVGKSWDGPLPRTGNLSGMAEMRKFAETVGLAEDAFDDVFCRPGALGCDKRAESGDMAERLDREAHLHT